MSGILLWGPFQLFSTVRLSVICPHPHFLFSFIKPQYRSFFQTEPYFIDWNDWHIIPISISPYVLFVTDYDGWFSQHVPLLRDRVWVWERVQKHGYCHIFAGGEVNKCHEPTTCGWLATPMKMVILGMVYDLAGPPVPSSSLKSWPALELLWHWKIWPPNPMLSHHFPSQFCNHVSCDSKYM